MCLAIPAKIIKLLTNDEAIAEIAGVEKIISTDLINDLQINDYVIVHVGYALQKIDKEEAEKTLEIFNITLQMAQE